MHEEEIFDVLQVAWGSLIRQMSATCFVSAVNLPSAHAASISPASPASNCWCACRRLPRSRCASASLSGRLAGMLLLLLGSS